MISLLHFFHSYESLFSLYRHIIASFSFVFNLQNGENDKKLIILPVLIKTLFLFCVLTCTGKTLPLRKIGNGIGDVSL